MPYKKHRAICVQVAFLFLNEDLLETTMDYVLFLRGWERIMVDLFVCVCFSCVFILFLLTVYAYVLMCSLSPVYLAGRCTVACIKKKKKKYERK